MVFKSLRTFLSGSDIAIDLGTSKTVIWVRGRGVVYTEPSIAIIDKVKNAPAACGDEAAELLKSLRPAQLSLLIPIRPVGDGVVRNFEVSMVLLQYALRKSNVKRRWARCIIGLPCSATPVERRAAKDVVTVTLPSPQVHTITKGYLAAVGAGLPVSSQKACMVVDVGCGTTEVAVIASSEVVCSDSIALGGGFLDEAIGMHIKRKFNLLIRKDTCEIIKKELGSAYPYPEDRELTRSVQGRDRITGDVREITFSGEEAFEAMSDCIAAIINVVRRALEHVEREYGDDIRQNGIVLTGGTSLLRDMDKRLEIETGVPVRIAEDPFTCVARGAGEVLADIDLLKRLEREMWK